MSGDATSANDWWWRWNSRFDGPDVPAGSQGINERASAVAARRWPGTTLKLYTGVYNHRFGSGAHCQGRPSTNRSSSSATHAHHCLLAYNLAPAMGGGDGRQRRWRWWAAAAIDAKRTGAVRPRSLRVAVRPLWLAHRCRRELVFRASTIYYVFQPFRLLRRNFRTSSSSPDLEKLPFSVMQVHNGRGKFWFISENSFLLFEIVF